MTGKTWRKNMGQTAQFFHQPLMVRGGSNVWAFRDQAFASAPGQTRFLIWVLEFGFWILDLFFCVLECDGKAMGGTEKHKQIEKNEKHTE